MSDQNNTLNRRQAAEFVADVSVNGGRMVLTIPQEVIEHREQYLFQSMEDLDVIDVLGTILHDAGEETGLMLLTQNERYVNGIGWAICALAQRVRGQVIGALAEEYTAGDSQIAEDPSHG